MPITQDRMIAAAQEGLALRSSLNLLKDEIAGILYRCRGQPQNAVQLIESILALHRTPSSDTLIAEAQHFRLARKKNERARNRNRRQAGRDETSQPQNAPLSLLEGLTAPADPMEEEIKSWIRGEKE